MKRPHKGLARLLTISLDVPGVVGVSRGSIGHDGPPEYIVREDQAAGLQEAVGLARPGLLQDYFQVLRVCLLVGV